MKNSPVKAVLICAALLIGGAAALGQGADERQVRRVRRPVPNRYLVVLADNQDADAVALEAEAVQGGRRTHVFRGALRGFAMRLTRAAAVRLARDPRVKYVEEDGVVQITQVPGSWGLDRIDQRLLPLDGAYIYGGSGTGVIVHVIDTGIRTTHQDFGGRAFMAADYVDDDGDGDPFDIGNDDSTPLQPDGADDCHGHGTHVAGTIGSMTYGVAKNVTLYSHRVLSCNGTGTASSVVAAIDAITADLRRPAVVNMSLAGDQSDALDDALRQSIASGVTYIVAAGNENADARNFSPAGVAEAITVGATSSMDARASFSNYGPGVDLFAAGVGITSTWRTSNSATAVLQGTSMAAPHVAGVAALHLEQHPDMTPAEVQNAILAAATPNVISGPGTGSPNRLLYSNLVHTTSPTVELLRPADGDNVLSNMPYAITWTASDLDGLDGLDVLLSTDGGATYQPLAGCTDLAATQQQCEWAAPGPVTASARIRVIARDLSGDSAIDQSNANFSIVTRPELVAFYVSSPPDQVSPGTTLTLSDTIRNVGNAAAGVSITRFYLSLDAVKSADDTLLSGTRPVPSLPVDAESAGTVSAVVPSTMPVGSYRLFACADATSVVVEADETNNCVPAAALLTVALSDLVVSTLSSVPTAAIPGTPFSVTGVVNNPTPVTAGASLLRYYLSGDIAKDAGDVLLTYRSVAALPAGTSSSGSTPITIPAATALGTYYVIACADDTVLVREVDETNNCLTWNTAILLTRPDLLTASVSNPPAAVTPGTAFTITAPVQNPSPVAAAASTQRYYLSADVLKGAGDILLTGARSVAALAAGTTSAGTTTVTVPAASVLGTYYVLACADDTLVVGETDEANNCLPSGSTVLLARPDLVLATMNPPPAGAAPGTTFAVTAAVQNPSPVTAPASTLRYYLSANAFKDEADILLTGTRSVAALSAGATSSGSTTVTVPATTALGAYYVLVCADDTLVVNEADEANNCLASGATVVVARPDLVLATLNNPPAGAAPGTTFVVTAAVQNPSLVTAPASTLRYYLSANALKDGVDVLLTGARAVPALLAGATSSGSTTVTVPATTALGTYYVLACGDDTLVVNEANETNNCLASGATVVVARPDLVLATLNNPPAGAAPGTTFVVTAAVQNPSPVTAPASTVRYYFSTDALKDGADTLLTATRPVAALLAGATSSGSTTVTVPTATVLGTYFVLACADDALVVNEADETNNCRASGTSVVVARPDLVLATLNDPPAGAAPGTTFVVTAAVQNPSPVTAPASTVRYYFSSDGLRDGADTLLTATRPVAALLAGATSSGNTTVTVPTTTVLGTYFVLACADDTLVVNEADETNNCLASGATVVVH